MKSINKNYFLNTVLLKLGESEKNNINLKQVLKIIHLFSINSKTIWFIGFNKTFNYKTHVFLPANFWLKGLIGNKKFVKTKQNKKPDLIVILNKEVTHERLTEFVVSNIPVIVLGSVKSSLKSCYIKVVPLKLEKKIKEFCLFLLYSVLKKSNEKKHIQT